LAISGQRTHRAPIRRSSWLNLILGDDVPIDPNPCSSGSAVMQSGQ
jgi:hypothetical protein